MSNTENGWPVLAVGSTLLRPLDVAGRSFPGGVRKGDVFVILRYMAAAYHCRVESLYYGSIDKDDWGYSHRPPSNHASGTAIDVNADTNPQGVEHSHTYAQEMEIRRILRECWGAVRWGRDFSTTPDPMHFDISPNCSMADAKIIAQRLLNPGWFHRDLRAGMSGTDVKYVQKRLKVTQTGMMDAKTVYAVNLLRGRLHFSKNGLVNKDLAYYIGTAR